MPDLESLIKELLDRREVDSHILELSSRVTSESALRELLILARETDQLNKILRSNNQKQVEILCGELLHNVYLGSKKDYLHKPGRRFVKALSAEATRRIQLSGNRRALAEESRVINKPPRKPNREDLNIGLGEEVYRCPSCMSIKISRKDLGGKCPRCFAKLPSDLKPSYRTKENAFGRDRKPKANLERAPIDEASLETKKHLICASCGNTRMQIDQVNAGRLVCAKCGSEKVEYIKKERAQRADQEYSPKSFLTAALASSKRNKVFHAVLITSIFAIGLGIAYRQYEERDRSTLKRYCVGYPSDDCAFISAAGRLWDNTPGLPLKRTNVRFVIRDKGDTKIAMRKDGKGRYYCRSLGLESGKGYDCTRGGWEPNLKYNYLSGIRESASSISKQLCEPSIIDQYRALSLYTRHKGLDWYREFTEPLMDTHIAGALSQELSEEEKRIGISKAERNNAILDAYEREKSKVMHCFRLAEKT